MVTKADVQAFMAERSEYTKANRFEVVLCQDLVQVKMRFSSS